MLNIQLPVKIFDLNVWICSFKKHLRTPANLLQKNPVVGNRNNSV